MFLEDVQADGGIETALLGAMADRDMRATGSDGGRGVPLTYLR